MQLNFNQTPEKIWCELHIIKNKFSQFSQLSVLDSQSERDQALQDCLTFISNLNWDGLNGGCYQKSDDYISLSLSNNLHLADFLFAASQTFFEGELSYVLKRTLNALINYLYSKQLGAFNSNLTFKTHQAPFVLSGTHLREVLSDDEITLLCALLDCENLDLDKNYWLSYKINLKQAADKSEINFKLAQILEDSLQFKIKEAVKSKYELSEIDSEINFIENSQALSLLVSVALRDKDSNYDQYIEAIKMQLMECLVSKTNLNNEAIISYCHGLIDYCQFNYQQAVLDLVIEKINRVAFENSDSDKLKIQLSEIIVVVKKLTENVDLAIKVNLESINTSKLEIIILTGRNAALESKRQALLSSYNPNRKIFIISATQNSASP